MSTPSPDAKSILEEKFNDLYHQSRQEFDAGHYENALRAVHGALEITPNNPMVLRSEAICLWRLGRKEQAAAICQRIGPALHGKEVGYHQLAGEICLYLDRLDEARLHGGMCLKLNDESVKNNKYYPISSNPPGELAGGQKIIAFSLYGARPRYCETAIINCDAAAEFLPGWSCRFYVDASVPASVIRRLSAKGAQIVSVDAATQASVHPLMWRFLVADDPNVARFAVRDADALIGAREAAAVRAWLESGRWFHVMRDWHTHGELMLAGM
ncbi:MAG: tetratricopeptide repeat protein, partial [Pseudomonadales bacterium]|nr:tetratricopeptide repeat protein [Pseudomonadales bacterium]